VIHEPVLEISCGQKQCAHTDRQTDRQTDTHTHRQTDTRRWSQYLAAYGAQVITIIIMKFFTSKKYSEK